MKILVLIISISICATTIFVAAQDGNQHPIPKEQPEKLVAMIQSMSEEISIAARFNVADDVAHKRIRIMAIAWVESAGETNDYGFDVQVVYDPVVANSKLGVGSYRFQQNSQVLAFAAAQFSSGNKIFGRKLVELLAEAEPDLSWSTPTHPALTIQQILVGLQKDDKTLNDFLTDETNDWIKTASLSK